MSYLDCCDWSRCTLCGECLVKCPVIEIGRKEAKQQIELLLKGEPAPRVFGQCTLCLSCNTFCPVEGLRPFELILQRITEQGDRNERVPALVPYMLNSASGPNFFREFYQNELDREERAILQKWSEPPPASRDVLYVGCLGKTICRDLENSLVMKDLPKFGPPDICCGEIHYRAGQWDAYTAIVEKTMARFRELQAERIVFYCGACRTYLGPVLNKVYGKQLPFRLTTIFEWLLERYENGELVVKRPLRFRAALHDFCNASELGRDFQDNLRKIYRAAGADFVELPHNRDQSFSCGAASIAREFSLGPMLKAQKRRYGEVKAAGVKDIAANCPGCYIAFSFTSWAYGLRPRYMPEELLKAFGDDITIPLRKRLPRFTKLFALNLPLVFKKVDPRQIRIIGSPGAR